MKYVLVGLYDNNQITVANANTWYWDDITGMLNVYDTDDKIALSIRQDEVTYIFRATGDEERENMGEEPFLFYKWFDDEKKDEIANEKELITGKVYQALDEDEQPLEPSIDDVLIPGGVMVFGGVDVSNGFKKPDEVNNMFKGYYMTQDINELIGLSRKAIEYVESNK